ncbi:MAG: hypothetical protein ABSG74_13725 [Candidatus Bathyarchaeia archaeon]
MNRAARIVFRGKLRMSKRNALTEQSIMIDDVLSMLTGHPRGTLVSFTEMTKSLHDYIKMNGLRQRFCPHCNAPLSGSPSAPQPVPAEVPAT